MLPVQRALATELAHTGPVTERQATQISGRLASAGYQGPIAWEPTEIAGLYRLGALDPARWGPEPDAAERRGMGHSSVPLAGGRQPSAVSLTARDVKKINAFVARLEQESER